MTMYDAPLPVTLVFEAPITPVVGTLKSDKSTPATFSLKVTANWTLLAFEGVAPARLIDKTVGGVVS